MNDDYREALDFLYGRLNYERSGMPVRGSSELRLGRMRRLLRRLDDPQEGLRIIHVAGTKGKGSTSAMIASALLARGIRTGLFTSPHLHRLEERFVVDGQPIEERGLVDLVGLIRPVVEAMDRDEMRNADRPLTFFEVTTAIGLLHFARSRVDAVILEVGMGGRLDSTNAVRPRVGVITSISYDHVRQLGPTLAHIATEKAGILKHRMPLVSGVVPEEPRAAIHQVARRRGTRLRELGVDFGYEYLAARAPVVRPTRGEAFVSTWRTEWGRLPLPLPGGHQAHNLAVALATLDLLAEVEPSLEVGRTDLERGLARLVWPARVEVLGRDPWLLIDGAHNVASAEAVARAVRECFPPGPRTLIFGTSRDKDLEGQLRVLLPTFQEVVATRYLENPRSVAPEEIAETTERLGGRAVLAPEPVVALEIARGLTPAHGLICLTGSLFLAAEARALLLGLPANPTSSTLRLAP